MSGLIVLIFEFLFYAITIAIVFLMGIAFKIENRISNENIKIVLDVLYGIFVSFLIPTFIYWFLLGEYFNLIHSGICFLFYIIAMLYRRLKIK